MAERTPITKEEFNKVFLLFSFRYNSCGSFENWHGSSYSYALLPVFKKWYGVGSPEFVEAIKRHNDFHNQEPVTGAVIEGIMLGMEEQKALGQDIDPELIRGTKSSLMGPVAGIGDSLVQATLVPLLLSIAISMSQTSNGYTAIGCIFYLIAVLAILFAYGYFLFKKGYELGKDAVTLLAGETIARAREAISMFGVMLVGALAGNYVAPKTILKFTPAPGADPTTIQSILDGIFPNILGLALTLFMYWLITKKNVGTFKLLMFTILATIVLAYVGII